ncbi:MAG: FtsQ-type POTRA domain-containing protein [Spirochaetales bacterium]|nr:FtsQ-type POTRA domain-containing protein [Spirochaetales bacterium]
MSEAVAFGRSKTPRSESLFTRLLWVVVCLLALLLAGEILFHFVIAPRLVVRNVRIRTSLPLSEEEVLAIAGLDTGEYYFRLDTEEIRRRLEAYPMIRSATVEKHFPDSVELFLQEREPLSMLLYEAPDGRSVPVVIDEEGVVFQIGAAVSAWNLPVLTGVKFRELAVGSRLPEQVWPLLAELQSLREAQPELYALISELRIVSRTAGRYELLMYPVHEPVRVRLGSALEAGAIRNALMVIDVFERQGIADRVRELDLRTGEVVYTMKED